MYLTKEQLYGNAKAKFLMVKASNSLAGLKVFKTILKLYAKQQTDMSIVSYDASAGNLLSSLNLDMSNIELFNEFEAAGEPEKSQNLMSIDVLEERFSSFKGVLCIFSLTSLVTYNGIDRVYKTFYKLLNTNSDIQVLSLLYSDVHDESEISIMDNIATTTLSVNDQYLKSVVHYSTGKVREMKFEYKISNFELASLVDIKMITKSHVKQPDPTANLTFNLKLKDEEKEAKNQLQLPYMKMQTSDEAVIQNLMEMDFYDEEDPDDDLDI